MVIKKDLARNPSQLIIRDHVFFMHFYGNWFYSGYSQRNKPLLGKVVVCLVFSSHVFIHDFVEFLLRRCPLSEQIEQAIQAAGLMIWGFWKFLLKIY